MTTTCHLPFVSLPSCHSLWVKNIVFQLFWIHRYDLGNVVGFVKMEQTEA
jgi:hypothetical protein